MKTPLWKPILLSLALVSAGVGGTYLLRQHKATPAPSSLAKPSVAAKAVDTPVLTVDELAANPSAHIGTLQLIGVVATVERDKQFVLIDEREFRECKTSCLTSAETKKIAVRWTGEPPVVEQAVRVTGELTHTAKGYTFTAREVGKR